MGALQLTQCSLSLCQLDTGVVPFSALLLGCVKLMILFWVSKMFLKRDAPQGLNMKNTKGADKEYFQ